jgi:hypothetical protein
MRVTALIVTVTLASLFGVAAAEKVKTNQETKIYSRPGEQAKVIVKVKSGQNMTLLAQDGRWLKVRVQGRTGFVPRSMVDMPEGDEIVRNTRRRAFVDGRSTRRGFGGESPDDRVGADATGDNAAGGDDEEKEKPSKSKDDDKGKRVATKASKQKDVDDEEEQPKSTKKKPEKPKGDKAKGDKAKADKADKEDKGGGDDEEELKVTDDNGDDASADESRPTAHVSEKAVVYNERDKESGEMFVAKPNMTLYPGETKGKWTFVENDDGDGGWIMSSQLDVESGGGGEEGGARRREIDVGARLGWKFIQQGMRTTGGAATFPDTYNLGTSAAAISLGGGIMYPFGKSAVFGGEATLDYAKTLLGGVSVPGSSVQEGISLMTFSLRASAGYDLHKKNGMTVLGRLGYRYQAFLVDGYADPAKNPANLPQETFAAPTLGAALAIPRLTPKIGLGFTLDTILFGASIAQTKGLQDGTKPDAKAAYVGVVFTYHWKKDMDLLGTYNLDFASYNFGPPSMDPNLNKRMHTGTDVTRTDIFHMVTFGIAKGF